LILLGKALLILLGTVQAVATPFYDFNDRHLGHPGWPPHARFHCVAYTLLNVGCGAVTIWLVLAGHFAFAIALLGWAAALQFIACLFPGVTPVADGERILVGLPVSLWGSALYLALTAIAALIVL
jgi:hypothetical protein